MKLGHDKFLSITNFAKNTFDMEFRTSGERFEFFYKAFGLTYDSLKGEHSIKTDVQKFLRTPTAQEVLQEMIDLSKDDTYEFGVRKWFNLITISLPNPPSEEVVEVVPL